ncbi:hypothetical protein FMM75_22690 [Lachnospiraceae bacterium MD335]|nr:hypothetical protein [Lachnospiraceae bacterium MD335]
MALYKKFDLYSISEGLDKMMDYYYKGNEKDSPYWDHYCEQINELCNAAADMYTELESVKNRIWCQMPAKKIAFCDEDDCSRAAVAWFNTAAAMLSDTDMTKLLESENIYGADILTEKQKRINALNKLTKHQQMFLYTEVIGFITRYLELSAAFETIEAVINELDYHQSVVRGNEQEETVLPQSAYI